MTDSNELLGRIQAHLQQVQADPSTQLDEKLLDTAGYVLLPLLDPSGAQSLVLELYKLLPTLQQDPTPAIRLLTKLLEPVPLSNILSLEPPVDFVAGLNVAAQPFNLLTLSLLEKADAVSARRLASTYQQVFVALVMLWLSTEDEAVADKANKVLVNLLKVDVSDSDTVGRNGPVWKRIFRDKDVYEQIFAITDIRTGKHKSLSKNRKTIAQARLMDWLPAVATLDWTSISQSYHPEIESSYGLPSGQQSLLDYAATYMVDYKDDVLMHRTLVDFYSRLLLVKTATSTTKSPALDFLVAHGHHERTALYYIQPSHPSHDPIDNTFLYGPAAHYVATWTSTYPQDFASNIQASDRIIAKITSALEIPISRWSHAASPSEDLHVLSSLPRPYLASLSTRSPHLIIPSRASNSDALNTLATLFHGPIEANTITFPLPPTSTPDQQQQAEEIKAAQELYTTYLTHNTRLWSDTLTHADTIALKEPALAATNLLKAVITAPWDGVAAILQHPSARSNVVPWLLAPPKTFSNLVGGHGDAESAAYAIAMARWDVLRTFFERVKSVKEFEGVAVAARARIAEGVWGRGGEVGGRVGVLEL